MEKKHWQRKVLQCSSVCFQNLKLKLVSNLITDCKLQAGNHRLLETNGPSAVNSTSTPYH
uniref:Uncharacterized protein n=1 Tax=Anguilla anguilla TaxID=7936 RepID=A0A0E9XCT9_ANGAN